jgi:alpha-beta hydrolase superfamily lysophospholipase
MKYKYFLFLSFLIFGSCSNNSVNRLYAENELPQYWGTTIPNPKGLVVVAHGLNVKPSKMGTPSAEGTLVKLLLDSGYNVYRVTLKGHYGPIEEMQSVTRADWIENAYVQYCQAKIIADNDSLPLYLLGFSLGALVYEVFMNEETVIPVRFEKIILFSPAVAIRPSAKTVLWLKPFTNDGSIIRSASPEEYRAQTGTSIAAYRIV